MKPRSVSPLAGHVSLRFSILWILVALTVSTVLIACQSDKAASQQPPVAVEVVAVTQQDVPIYEEWVATLDGYENAQIQPQVTDRKSVV